MPPAPDVLSTTAGDLPLTEVQLEIAGRMWTVLHSDAVISREEEQRFLKGETAKTRPYGVVLWPAAIALAHEIATRPLAGKRILELGAGTGLPGIVAAALGAQVVQTDRQKLVVHVCQQNAARNGVTTIEHRVADWTEWEDTSLYELVIGSDILYTDLLHPFLRRIFERNLAPGGSVVISDPFRAQSLPLFESMEADGWKLTLDRWSVGVTPPPRDVGVFALTRGTV